MHRRPFITFLLLSVILTGCGHVGSAAPVTENVTAAYPVATALPSLTAIVHPSPTATATPTATLSPTVTLTPIPPPISTATAIATLTPTPDPANFVNGVPVKHFIVMPPAVQDYIRRIFARGQQLGRDPHAFSKLGDSISLTNHYFARFDQGRYDQGIFDDLQPTIDYFQDSFERFGMAVRIGLHAWIAFRPGLANPEKCHPDEHMVECEFRLHNPSVLLIRLGTNDTAPGDAYERAILHAIDYSVHNGVIPVLITKSDRFEGDDRHNETLRRLAAEHAIPLWDFDVVAGTLPDRGLGSDKVHLTMYGLDDYSDPATLSFGYPLSDLTGLMMLDAIRLAVHEVPGE